MTSFAHPLAAVISAALIGLAVAPPAAHAAPDEKTALADFFAGTLEIDLLAGGWSARRWLAADHTYRETGSDGDVHGTWSIENGKICTVRDKPKNDPDRIARYCNEGVGRHVGETWNDADPVTGNIVMFALKPGR
jgi:hypothetical protein